MRRRLLALLAVAAAAAVPAWAGSENLGTRLSDSPGVGSVVEAVRELERKQLEHEHLGDDGSTAIMPVGMYVPYAGATAPARWLLCDGSAYSTTAYPKLFAVIGYSYGGSGGNFNVPDMRGRAPIGAGTGTGLSTFAVGQSTGTETISTAQMPVHSHGVTDPQHRHRVDYRVQAGGGAAERAGPQPPGDWTEEFTGYSATGISINSAGGGNTFRSPSLAGNFIIFAGE